MRVRVRVCTCVYVCVCVSEREKIERRRHDKQLTKKRRKKGQIEIGDRLVLIGWFVVVVVVCLHLLQRFITEAVPTI